MPFFHMRDDFAFFRRFTPHIKGAIARKMKMKSLAKRYEFTQLRDRGRKQVTPFFILQAFDHQDERPARYGLTASKKIGNAVRRNKARRRLRALVHGQLEGAARTGFDYGLIARFDCPDADFAKMEQVFVKAIAKLHHQFDHQQKEHKAEKGKIT